jgi:hypothetical protein
LIKFLKALIKQAGCKVFLVLDNLGVHHRAPVKKWGLSISSKSSSVLISSHLKEPRTNQGQVGCSGMLFTVV